VFRFLTNRNRIQHTPALKAAKMNNLHGLKTILEYYPEYNLSLAEERDENDWTALHRAVALGNCNLTWANYRGNC